MARPPRASAFILYFFERLFSAAFILVGRVVALRHFYPFAELVGTAGVSLFPFHRRRVMGNLQLAFGGEKTSAEKHAIFRESTINFLKNSFEMLYSANRNRQRELLDSIRIKGREHLDCALKNGKGVIAVSGHFGNFGIVGLKLKDAGYGFHTVARAFSDPLRKTMYTKYRIRQGQSFIYTRTAQEAVKGMLKALRRNETIFLITDENVRHGGVFVKFFDRLASTSSAPAVLHLRTGADILPVFLLRNQDNTQTLLIEPPLGDVSSEGTVLDADALTQRIAQRLEEYVREHPSQWMWTHRRWRTRPEEEKAQGIDESYRRY
jgi:Kdo2-lipid IVA lauroyltransferase/acyltransferase